MIVDFEHGHVLEEIYGSHFNTRHLNAQTLGKVGNEFGLAVGADEVDVVVAYVFAARIGGEERFAKRDAAHEGGVDRQNQAPSVENRGFGMGVDVGLFAHLAVDDAQCDEEEKIGHFADGEALRAVTNNAEDGKKTEGCAHADIAHRIAQKEEDEEEDAHREEHIGEIIIAAVAFGVIEEVDNTPHHEGVQAERTKEMRNHVEIKGLRICV